MQLLNAKTLLVIAALCALMAGLLTQIERHQQKAEQVQEQREQQAEDFWKGMQKEKEALRKREEAASPPTKKDWKPGKGLF